MLDTEKLDSAPNSPPGSSHADSSPQESKELEAAYPMRDHSISRTRSHNGYGCDEGTEDHVVGVAGDNDIEGQSASVRDPFEVHWDGGDSDPVNPRNFSKAKKWIVVLIVSASSVCV